MESPKYSCRNIFIVRDVLVDQEVNLSGRENRSGHPCMKCIVIVNSQANAPPYCKAFFHPHILIY